MLLKCNFSIISIVIFLFSCINAYPNDFNLGPLYHRNLDSEYKTDYDALGPFITFKRDQDHSEFGFRPLFYSLNNQEKDITEFDFLYPLSSYKRRGNSSSGQILFHLIKYESELNESGFMDKEFDFFPFIFYRNFENSEQNHFAFFPFYGNLKNKFSKDQIRFFLFPLYLESRSEEDITKSFVWPFISSYSGGHKGFRVWPLWGKRVREKDSLDQTFALWPIFVRSEKVFYGEKVYSFSLLPFYSESRYPNITHKSYFWPFINHVVDEKSGYERWDTPWPFINFTRGYEPETNGSEFHSRDSQTQTRIFPIYSTSRKGDEDRDGFILWPVYRYSRVKLENNILDKKSLFLFLFRDIRLIPSGENGKSGRRIDLWPLFTYEKDDKGKTYFHTFTILEPFIRSNNRLYRNYASFWRIFEWRRNADYEIYSSFLWNLYTMYKGENFLSIEIRPILPVFSYKRMGYQESFSLFGGLIGYKEKDEKNVFKFLYISFDL